MIKSLIFLQQFHYAGLHNNKGSKKLKPLGVAVLCGCAVTA